MEINLLEKTELWIDNVTLENVDLNRVAEVAGDVLGIERNKILVVDVRADHITLDILQKTMQAEQLYGKKAQLLNRLSAIPGFKITERTEIHSDGILGMIALDETEAGEVLHRSSAIAADVLARVSKRACVFPTGLEVKRGMILDTNTSFIKTVLEEKGFQVTCAEALDDDRDVIAGRIQRAINEGYGLVITTGGVGAEAKDRTVEAVLAVDPEAELPYIMHFTQGAGRHEKDGVRIAVGAVGCTTIVSLPGPNDEVRAGLPVLLEALEQGRSKSALASSLAGALRARLRDHHTPNGEKHGPSAHSEHR